MKAHLLVAMFVAALITWELTTFVGCSKPQAAPAQKGKAAQDVAGWQRLERPGAMEAGALPDQVGASLASTETNYGWQPKVSKDGTRGPSRDIYPRVAPAIVVVRCGRAHGTGFLTDKDGWILTNHHVIAGAAPDPKTGAGTVMIHLGQIHDGWMRLLDEAVPATVYKASVQKDLALLKLARRPAELKELPVILFANGMPAPGSDCISIGHPAAGALWMVREGVVSGAAVWPKEKIDVVLTLLSAAPGDREKMSQALARAPQRKVILSSCGLNPGDSGGPLVDADGRLIAVSFAIPRSEDPGISFDKFSYHVDLEEVKDFVARRPKEPLVLPPDPCPPGRYHRAVDLDEDGEDDAIVFGMAEESPPTGALVKLKSDDSLKALIAGILSPGKRAEWHFEFAWQTVPIARTFYDTDGNGKSDLVLTDVNGDEKADSVLRLVDGKWKPEPPENRPMFAASCFTEKSLAKRFKDLKLEKQK